MAAEIIATASAVPPPFAATALALTVQDWTCLGIDISDESISDLKKIDHLVDQVTSLLLVRIVAVFVTRNSDSSDAPTFVDLSCSTICRTVLVQQKPWMAYAPQINDAFLGQLKSYVRTILMGYNDTPYHCMEHAMHVVLSVSKLTDIMLQTEPATTKTFGLRYDAVAQLAMVFAALVHDVEHKGVPNRQLVIENDPLAVLYNDQSVAEHRSLFIAFDQLLKPDFATFRCTLFGFKQGTVDSDDYRRFRKMVVDLVLNTDIASPERTQLAKSKWKEAFGDTFESIERKLKHQLNETNGDDDSVSGSETPESSEHRDEDTNISHEDTSVSIRNIFDSNENESGYDASEHDGVILSGTTLSANNKDKNYIDGLLKEAGDYTYRDKEDLSRSRDGRRYRRSHAHSMPMGRRSSVQLLLQSDEYVKAKFQRRMSSYATPVTAVVRPENFRKRLGIRRSMDLGGEAIEFYSNSATSLAVSVEDVADDEPDELKAAVVMETILTAADVAHNLQGWKQMVIWSGRLYLELRKAHVEQRGGDPQVRWFENQIGFLESYLLPLARRLEDTGVFGEHMGQTFAATVEANRDKWLIEGMAVTQAIVTKGEGEYNEEILAEEQNIFRS